MEIGTTTGEKTHRFLHYTVSTSSMQADPPKFLSQPLPRKKKIRIKGGSLHGGPDGFFASV
ncbi:hypothetical protein OH77DRAFT_1432604 [Trametes cingulata]|nr:hypothetical protein OH77DRAFT_1432604 [Trametes cingulata]